MNVGVRNVLRACEMCRDVNWFHAEVKTPPGERINFVLSYEQLLQRRHGSYQLSLPLGYHTVCDFCFCLLVYYRLYGHFSGLGRAVCQVSVYVCLNNNFSTITLVLDGVHIGPTFATAAMRHCVKLL